MIEVEGLKKSFGQTEILKGLNVTFETGKTNLIIGSSGAGKTVFLKCLIGLYEPTSGEISYGGQYRMSSMNFKEKQAFRTKIGMVFQGSALFDNLTVEENIRFPLDMFSDLSSKEKQYEVDKVSDRVNLSHAMDRYPSQISGGMQKRVAIARAVINSPLFLFCDEPNSGLDPKTAIVIDELIQEITREYNTTTVINTHDMNSVLEIGEKIFFLKDGLKEWEGDKEQILTAKNPHVVDFVYSSGLFKELRKTLLAKQ